MASSDGALNLDLAVPKGLGGPGGLALGQVRQAQEVVGRSTSRLHLKVPTG